ncbi:hypothetical protein BGP77_13235 [Saccharospirillum sp. MSK14-1]|uniref:molybdopterin-dependent oxidoreductase n=1 Tax=Saccharospirillum sp. MSK14-1 TaxID=1897632 RepID=UPI000D475118|nr:molybdopterin-dependent oxidoreductase [Saccharospirillum sp. MSK14-1]PTY37461.1 hypothetical protein BGP77_13235 [Saccharospirillum sp. MSK14-1]
MLLVSQAFGYDLVIGRDAHSVRYTQTDLLALDDTILETETPWTDGLLQFEGAHLATVLDDADIRAEQLLASALNGYSVVISVATAIEEGAFIAVQMDGRPMRVRDKGPFWLVFPWSDKPELLNREVRSWSIWQLQRLEPVE